MSFIDRESVLVQTMRVTKAFWYRLLEALQFKVWALPLPAVTASITRGYPPPPRSTDYRYVEVPGALCLRSSCWKHLSSLGFHQLLHATCLPGEIIAKTHFLWRWMGQAWQHVDFCFLACLFCFLPPFAWFGLHALVAVHGLPQLYFIIFPNE